MRIIGDITKRITLMSKEVQIFMDPDHIEQNEEPEKMADYRQFASLIGFLLYVAVDIHPDIVAAVSILGKSMSAATQAETKKILCYLH